MRLHYIVPFSKYDLAQGQIRYRGTDWRDDFLTWIFLYLSWIFSSFQQYAYQETWLCEISPVLNLIKIKSEELDIQFEFR